MTAAGTAAFAFLAFPLAIRADGAGVATAKAPAAILPILMTASPAIPLFHTPIAVRFMRITAYASTPDETDNTPFITASGLHVRDGIVASNILPFGTKLELPRLFGSKIFTVEDRTAPRFRETVDIWMATRRAAVDFGVEWTDVVIVSEPAVLAARVR